MGVKKPRSSYELNRGHFTQLKPSKEIIMQLLFSINDATAQGGVQ